MRVLKPGVTGNDVKKWQLFLLGQGFTTILPSGNFDQPTYQATVSFQTKCRLDPDGKVGNDTLGKAMTLGYELIDYTSDEDSDYPEEPDFRPLVGIAARQQVFGKFSYVAAPQPDNPEAIRITDGWEAENIVKVELPQLAGVKGAPSSGTIRFHRLAAKQIQALFRAWGKARVIDRIVTWDGSFNARFSRGSTTALSNHAFGSALDINAAFNPLGSEPGFPGEKGCVFDLVSIAHDHGFFWGGHFSKRRDGMHFEVAEIG